MEESTNLHHLHLHLQDVQPPAPDESSKSLTSRSCYGSGSWIPNISNLNAGSFNNPNLQDGDPRSRALTQKSDIGVPPRPLNGSMIQDLGYNHHQWTTRDSESCLTTNPSSTHDLELQFSKIKDEISDRDTGFPKFTQMLNSSSSMKNNNEHKDMNALNNLNEKLLLKTLYSGGDFYSNSSSIQNNYRSFGGGGVGVPSRGSFSQIYPSINISNLNHSSNSSPPPISSSSSLDMMSTQSLDLLTSTTTFGSQGHDLGRFTDNLSFRLQHHLQQSTDRSSSNNNIRHTPHFANGMAETKRASTLMESSMAAHSQTASKKSRLESCPPLKVRKEKLGDRIAALQQLVAPFGKTDTASVLMEAIGYIKFLQSQVETLSVPYMKSSQKHNNRVMQGGSGIGDTNEESKQDLRSRGLCLVPLACMSYIAGDGGCDVWQQPGGAT